MKKKSFNLTSQKGTRISGWPLCYIGMNLKSQCSGMNLCKSELELTKLEATYLHPRDTQFITLVLFYKQPFISNCKKVLAKN